MVTITENTDGTYTVILDFGDGCEDNGRAGEGELKGDLDGFVVTKYNFIGSNLKGDKYAALVAEPLVFDFDCKSTTIFTDGREAFEVNDEKSSIDFGNGDCDNIFTIFLEGVTIIVDLDKINA